jgi:hypothetical protein
MTPEEKKLMTLLLAPILAELRTTIEGTTRVITAIEEGKEVNVQKVAKALCKSQKLICTVLLATINALQDIVLKEQPELEKEKITKFIEKVLGGEVK